MDRDPDRPRLVCDGSGDRLADPPCGIGAELISLVVIKLLHSLNESQIALLDQIQKQHSAAHIPLGNADHQTQVCLRQLLLGILVPVFHPLGKLDLTLGAQKRNFSDLLQIHAHRIFDADSIRNREINVLNIHVLFLGQDHVHVNVHIIVTAADPEHIDIVGFQVFKYLVHLFRIELHVTEKVVDLLDLQDTLLFLAESNQVS